MVSHSPIKVSFDAVNRHSGGGKGGGASVPGGTVQGVAFGGATMWNSDIYPLLLNTE